MIGGPWLAIDGVMSAVARVIVIVMAMVTDN